MTTVLRIHPGAFRLMRALHENETWDIEEYSQYRHLVPERTWIHEIRGAFAEEQYGVEDLYVVLSDGELYGIPMYRGLGKHDYYSSFSEYPVDGYDYFELKPLETIVVSSYKFVEDK